MNTRTATLLNIGISVVFAIAMLFTSSLLDGTNYEQTVMFMLIALWFVPFATLSRHIASLNERQ